MARTGYAQLSNQLWLNDKANDLLEADPLAFGIWVMSISYASDNLTDGLLTRRALRRLGADESICATLIEFGVWERVDDTTVRIHDYLKHNRTRAEVIEEREKANERLRRFRQRHSTQQTTPDPIPTDETVDETPEETLDEMPDETVDETVESTPQDETHNETRFTTEHETADETRYETKDETGGETLLKTQTQTQNKLINKTHTRVRGVGEGEEPTPPDRDPTFEDRQFATLWDTWPKKTAKRDARRAYHHALRRTSATVILAAATRIRDDPNKPETRYLPRLDRWLDSDGWHDDPYPPTTRGEPTQAKPRALTNAEYNRQFIESLPD